MHCWQLRATDWHTTLIVAGGITTVQAISVSSLTYCSVFGIQAYALSFESPPPTCKKCNGVKSGDRGGYFTPLRCIHLLGFPIRTSQNAWTLVLQTSVSRYHFLADFLRNCVKACDCLKTFVSWTARFECATCSHFALFSHSWTYRAIVQLLHVLVVFPVHFSVSVSHSHSPFSSRT
jgi:hypothetical protein